MYEIIGSLAAAIGTIMFIPQTWRVIRTKHTKDISLATQVMFFMASILWAVYGFGVQSGPIMFVNIVIGIQIMIILCIKIQQDVLTGHAPDNNPPQ